MNSKKEPKKKSEPKKENPKVKPKSKPKPKPKPKAKSKRESKVIIELEKKKEPDEQVYGDKLKSLLFKIKNQNNYNDTGIRFAWKN